MSDPQIWTLIGVFAASMFGMLGLTSTLFLRVLRTEIGGLRGEIVGKIDALGSRLDGKIDALGSRLDGKIDSLESRLDGKIDSLESRLTARIDLLDKDISVIVRRVFPEEP